MKKLATIKVQGGKEYVMVKDRVAEFHNLYPKGSIVTDLMSSDGDVVVFKATVYPEGPGGRFFTGHSASNPTKQIEKISPYEVSETSAVGRALAFLNIGIIESIASAEEIKKATSTPSLDNVDPLLDDEAEIEGLINTYKNPKSPAQKNWAKNQLMARGRLEQAS